MKSNKSVLRICLTGFLFVTLQVADAKSQDIRSDLSGLYANLEVNVGQWNTSSDILSGLRDEDPSGWGVQLSGGYGFNQRMEGFLHLSYSNFNMSNDWDTYAHTEFGVGFRYNFGATLSKIRPFADVQLSTSNLEIDRVFIEMAGVRTEGAFSMSGLSIIAGAGVRYFFRPWVAATLHARYHAGMEYDTEIAGTTIDFDEDLDLTQIDLGVGITWYFGKQF